MVVWGITDQHSWISDKWPLLFDSNTKEKPAFYSVQEALRHYVATGIADVYEDGGQESNASIHSRQYFTLDGKPIPSAEGICVEQITYTNGSKRAHVVKK